MAGRLQRIRDRDTGKVTGYVLDGTEYDAQQFHAQLQKMFMAGDPFAREAIEKLDDFRVLRAQLPRWKAEITAREAKAKGVRPIPQDRELIDAEVADIDRQMLESKTTEVQKVQLRRRREQLVKASEQRAYVESRTSPGQIISETRERMKARDAGDMYKYLILTLERSLGRKPTKQEIDNFIRWLNQ